VGVQFHNSGNSSPPSPPHYTFLRADTGENPEKTTAKCTTYSITSPHTQSRHRNARSWPNNFPGHQRTNSLIAFPSPAFLSLCWHGRLQNDLTRTLLMNTHGNLPRVARTLLWDTRYPISPTTSTAIPHPYQSAGAY